MLTNKDIILQIMEENDTSISVETLYSCTKIPKDVIIKILKQADDDGDVIKVASFPRLYKSIRPTIAR